MESGNQSQAEFWTSPAGLLSPMLGHSGLALALGAAAFTAAGWLFWWWETHAMRRALRAAREPAGLEPTDL